MESDPKKIRDGNARMFFELQKEQKDKRLQEEKKKEKKRKDRLRYLIQKEAKGTLSAIFTVFFKLETVLKIFAQPLPLGRDDFQKSSPIFMGINQTSYVELR